MEMVCCGVGLQISMGCLSHDAHCVMEVEHHGSQTTPYQVWRYACVYES